MKRSSFFAYSFFAFLLLAGSLYSQENNGKPIELKYADSLVGNKLEEGTIRMFEGHVRFVQGNVHVISDKATQFLDENRAELTGNVVVTQEDMILKAPRINWNGNTNLAYAYEGVIIDDKNQRLTARQGTYSTVTLIADFEKDVIASDDTVKITADRIQYNRRTRKSFAYGNIKVEDDSSVITADFGEYYRATQESYAYGNVLVRGKYNNSYLTGDTIFNIPEKRYTLAKGNPILNQIDSSRKTKKITVLADSFKLAQKDSTWLEYDTMSVVAKVMEQMRYNDEIFLFKDSVKISRKSLSTMSNNATFYKRQGLIILEGTPIVWNDSTQLHSDSIVIFMPNNKLSSIHAYGNSLAATREDTMDLSRINQIIGNEIEIKFAEDTIRAIVSNGNAKSLYYMRNQDGEDGAARNSSDTLNVEFIKGEAENIRWLGGIQGEYFPEVIIIAPKEYYLPNFRWSDSKPRLTLNKYFKEKLLNNQKNEIKD